MVDATVLDQDLVLSGDASTRKRAREEVTLYPEQDVPTSKRPAEIPILATELPLIDEGEAYDIYIPSSFVGGGLFNDKFRNPQPYNRSYSIMIPRLSDRFTLDDIDLPFDKLEWMLVGVVLYLPRINFELKRISVEHLAVAEMDRLETTLTQLAYGATEVATPDELIVTTQVKSANFFADLFKHCLFKEQTTSRFTFLPKSNKSQHILIKQDLTFINPSLVPGFALDRVEATRELSVLMLYAGETRFFVYLKAYTISVDE
jgi:hypothetical protein